MRPSRLPAMLAIRQIAWFWAPAALLFCAQVTGAQTTGASSSESPYLERPAGAVGVEFTAILTVGDSPSAASGGTAPYRMAGLPDGLGAVDNANGTITVLMNHELGSGSGVVRRHGGAGAFISTWQIRKSDLTVLQGGDFIDKVNLWNAAASSFIKSTNVAFHRFCAADLPPSSAFYNSVTGKGLRQGRIFMNGEEAGDEGRAFAHVFVGQSKGETYELPYMGKYSYENSVASPHMQDLTIVAGLDDDELTDSELYFYVGEKQSHGSPVERAGLMNGRLYGLRVLGAPQTEDDLDAFDAVVDGQVQSTAFAFGMVDLGVVAGMTGAQLEAESQAAQVTNFRRVEDGAWDPNNPNVFYFVTTATFSTPTRLWRVTFDDIENPTAGGAVELVLNGGDGVQTIRMMDNMVIDTDGDVILQEDPGGNPHLARIWMYRPSTGVLSLLAEHDPERFDDAHSPAGPSLANESYGIDYFVQDEESSGVIDVTGMFAGVPGYDTLNNRYYLAVAQAHRAVHPGWTADDTAELIEGGQLLLVAAPK